MNVGWMYFPSAFSPKISSMSFPLPMVSSTSMPMERAAARSSSSDFPSMSKPVWSRMAWRIVTRGNGARNDIRLSPTFTSSVPLTSRQIISSIFSVKAIIQL